MKCMCVLVGGKKIDLRFATEKTRVFMLVVANYLEQLVVLPVHHDRIQAASPP